MFEKLDRSLFSPRLPLDPARLPIYYGWVVLVAGSVGALAAAPVSPPGMAPFVDPMLEAMDLSRSRFALAYMAGTLLAGVMTMFAGRWVDRLGVRRICTFAFLLLGGSLCLLGVADLLVEAAVGRGIAGVSAFWPIALLGAGFFAARLLGLGLVMTAVRVMVIRWFVRKRNLVVAINGAAIALSFTALPALLIYPVEAIGWRQTWLAMGALFGTGFSVLAWAFFRDSPADAGLADDDTDPGAALSGRKAIPDGPDHTAGEALRTRAFWAFSGGLVLNCIVGTGVAFHLASLGTRAGLEKEFAMSLLLLGSVVNLAVTAGVALAGQRVTPRHLLWGLVAGLAIDLAGLLMLETSWGWAALVVGSGIHWACFAFLLAVPWPRYFGRAHVGTISGLATGIMMVSTALGPYVFGLSADYAGDYQTVLIACVGALIPLAVVSLTVPAAPGEH
ncbi:MAG: MFS transporter [Phycisphaeraceae bacterium]